MSRGFRLLVAAASFTLLLPTFEPARGQDQNQVTKDVIFARKTLMNSLSDEMDKIETMIDTGKINLASAKDSADLISVMLMAFPHMFPASSNQWKPNADLDPATDTFASPDAWSKYPDFYKRATDASKAAYEASRAENDAGLKREIGTLRNACNSCHAIYLKTQ
jgi:cytochrome c556